MYSSTCILCDSPRVAVIPSAAARPFSVQSNSGKGRKQAIRRYFDMCDWF